MGRFISKPRSGKKLSKDEIADEYSDFILDKEKTSELKALFDEASRVVGKCLELDFLGTIAGWNGDEYMMHPDGGFAYVKECLQKLIARANAETEEARATPVISEYVLQEYLSW